MLTVYESFEELPEDAIFLINEAAEARKRAYAPYSKFLVGAAILLENGKIITGNNQENASYPTGLCAERTAIFYARSKYPGVTIKMMALTAGAGEGESEVPIPPCGSCRQAISEYETSQNEPIELFFMGVKGKIVKSKSIANLLPLAFERSML